MGVTGLPRKVSPCPIHEAILEVRYESKAPAEAILGLVYSQFQDSYPKIEKQPVLQIPEAIRDADINLRNIPEYRLAAEHFSLLVGRHTFAVANVGDYCGWTAFSSRIQDALSKLERLPLLEKVTRIGLRYINAFAFDIMEKSTLRVMLGDSSLNSTSKHIVAQIPCGDFVHMMRVANNTEIKSGPNVFIGSVIDIDTAYEPSHPIQFNMIPDLIETAHNEEKRLFFSLLTDQFLESLNPKY